MTKKIYEELTKGHQDLTLNRIEEKDGKKFKYIIHSDSSPRQCTARAYYWNDKEWVMVFEIHYSVMDTKHCLYVVNGASRSDFVKDLKTLQNMSYAIVF